MIEVMMHTPPISSGRLISGRSNGDVPIASATVTMVMPTVTT
jgi:hypothetical protein